MMYFMHLTFAVELIALSLGTMLLIWAAKSEGCCTALGKVMGYLVVILTILTMACTSYNALMHWKQGGFRAHHAGMVKPHMGKHDRRMHQAPKDEMRTAPAAPEAN